MLFQLLKVVLDLEKLLVFTDMNDDMSPGNGKAELFVVASECLCVHVDVALLLGMTSDDRSVFSVG